MGYFANLYTVEATAGENYVEVETSVYGGEAGERMYFSWGLGIDHGTFILTRMAPYSVANLLTFFPATC